MKAPRLNILIILLLTITLTHCKSKAPSKSALPTLQSTDISKIEVDCNDQIFELNQEDRDELFKLLSEAESIGMVKGIVHNNLYLHTRSGDTIRIRALSNQFKTQQYRDWAFKMLVEEDFLDNLCISYQNGNSMSSLATIKQIFDEYNENQESTDSEENKMSLSRALKYIENQTLKPADLELVINVWMYYTVTDFDTPTLTKNVLLAHQEEAIIAVKNRIDNPMEWETEDTAPFSELQDLLEFLERGY